MKKQEVIIEIEKHGLNWAQFEKWMIGQTFTISEEGEVIYYKHDVNGFILEKTKGVIYPWD